MRVGFKFYNDEFISRVSCSKEEEAHKFIIQSESSNTPIFKILNSKWEIIPNVKKFIKYQGKGCDVDYRIAFEFQNPIYQAASSYFKSMVGKTTLYSFIDRAKELNSRLPPEDVVGAKISPDNSDKELEENINFLVEKEEIYREVLIFKTLLNLHQQGFLTEEEYLRFKERYFHEKNFQNRIQSLFKVYTTKEEVETNMDKIRFHLTTIH